MDGSERRGQRPEARGASVAGRRAWLALGFVLVALTALVVLPVVFQRRAMAIREEVRTAAEPANILAIQAQAAFARELATLVGFHVLEREELLEQYGRIVAEEDRALTRLARLADRLDPEVSERVAELRARAEQWHRSITEAELFRRGVPADVFVQRIFELYDLFQATVRSAADVQAAVQDAVDERRAAVVEAERLQILLTTLLALIALAAAFVVFWLGWRLRYLAARLERRARQEVALREMAAALAAAGSVRESVQPIARAAAAVTSADGIYVERVVSEGEEIEVAAVAGKRVPPIGLRAPRARSLTEAVLRAGESGLLMQAGAAGVSVAPYLNESCPRCAAFVVPLASDSDVLGALVLLRRPDRPSFYADEMSRARTLAKLATLALRKVRALELERSARREAEAAVRARDDVLGIVSHDLRNPLNTIASSAALLHDVSLDEAERATQVEIIQRSAGRMDRLIQDLLDIARLEGGQPLSIEPHAIQVEPLLNEACDAFRAQAEEKSQRLECELPERLPPIRADRDRILQALSNLVGNALKFTGEGGRISLRARALESEVQFSVSDTGPGIREEDVPHIFDPFWQAKKTAEAGAGLGLPITHGIVAAHGGRIWVESEPGRGTTFHFTLLVAEVWEEEPPAEAA